MKRRITMGFLVALASVGFAAAVPPGCAGATGSKRFAFDASIGGIERDASAPFVFTTLTGWSVVLKRADVTLGPVYLNVVRPLTDAPLGLLDLFVKPAWAHGEGHLAEGRIVGEVLGQVTFSALSPGLVAFPVKGSVTEEQIRTAEVWFFPRPGVEVDRSKIDTVALDVEGEASRDGSSVRFRGKLVLDDTWQPDVTEGARGTSSIAELRKVRGIQAGFFPTEGGRLEVRFDVRRLFRGADFAALSASPVDADGTRRLVQAKTGTVTTDQVMRNLYQGLREASGTYSVRWRDP